MIDIVQFKNGKYGIRKRSFLDRLFGRGGVFKDFRPILTNWRKPLDPYFKDCQTESIDEIKDYLNRITNNYVSLSFSVKEIFFSQLNKPTTNG